MTIRKTSQFQNFELENMFSDKDIVDFYKNLPPPLNNERAIFTLYGRNALFSVCRKIREIKPEKNQALVPSYSCGDEIEAVVHAGFSVIPYKINFNLQVDLPDLISKFSKRTSLVLLTHYFGFPQRNIFFIKKLCAKKGMFLIEDCAHVFGGVFKGIPLGSIGDASIFSLRKFLNIPHGGALVINNRELGSVQLIPPSNEAVLIDLLIFLGQKSRLFTKGTSIVKIYKQIGIESKSQHGPRLEEFGGYRLSMSNFTKFLIKKADSPKIIRDHINNFINCLNVFLYDIDKNAKRKMKPLFSSLVDGVVPSFFPIIVDESLAFCFELNKRGFSFFQPFWSYFHKYVNWNKFPEAKKLKEKLVVLPLNDKINLEVVIKNFCPK